MEIESEASLAPWTSLGLGGAAERLVRVESEAELAEALALARHEGWPVTLLGGGTNVVVADAGVRGLVVRVGLRGRRVHRHDDRVQIEVAAGEPWDDLVAWMVEEGWAGLECLSGIPGTAGATPIQNVGAYGQEVAERLVEVSGLDATTGERRCLNREGLGFGYRTSVLRRRPGALAVSTVRFELHPGGAPTLRYPELRRALGAGGGALPRLAEVRQAVLDLRRQKSMLLTPDDENRHSVGSFFVNPQVSAEVAARVVRVALGEGLVREADEVPRFAGEGGRVKLSAGWLIERAGFARGLRRGTVGISSCHALALVHYGGGTSAELVALAAEVRAGVAARFGVCLEPEPVFLGFAAPPLAG